MGDFSKRLLELKQDLVWRFGVGFKEQGLALDQVLSGSGASPLLVYLNRSHPGQRGVVLTPSLVQ